MAGFDRQTPEVAQRHAMVLLSLQLVHLASSQLNSCQKYHFLWHAHRYLETPACSSSLRSASEADVYAQLALAHITNG